MSNPLVSVVIPTHGRPQYLPRAVESALDCHGDSIEVIVVPNGPDRSWQQSLRLWQGDDRVTVSPISTAHGNAARNHGMLLARGKYLRFLDDDDYLLAGAKSQVAILERDGADVCSGLIENIDQEGSFLGALKPPATRDFVCAAVTISAFTLPVGNLYRRRAIARLRWDESVARGQDNVWMIDMARSQEWHWIHCNAAVGVWFQHSGTRTSSTQPLREREEVILNRLISLSKALEARGAWTMERRSSIARSMWYYIQRGFPSHPLYWSYIARLAREIDGLSRAPGEFYQNALFRNIHPLLLQWLLLPARWATRSANSLMRNRRTSDYRRQL